MEQFDENSPSTFDFAVRRLNSFRDVLTGFPPHVEETQNRRRTLMSNVFDKRRMGGSLALAWRA